MFYGQTSGAGLYPEQLLTICGMKICEIRNHYRVYQKNQGKIEKDPSRPEYILTVWGVGYKFCNLDEK